MCACQKLSKFDLSTLSTLCRKCRSRFFSRFRQVHIAILFKTKQKAAGSSKPAKKTSRRCRPVLTGDEIDGALSAGGGSSSDTSQSSCDKSPEQPLPGPAENDQLIQDTPIAQDISNSLQLLNESPDKQITGHRLFASPGGQGPRSTPNGSNRYGTPDYIPQYSTHNTPSRNPQADIYDFNNVSPIRRYTSNILRQETPQRATFSQNTEHQNVLSVLKQISSQNRQLISHQIAMESSSVQHNMLLQEILDELKDLNRNMQSLGAHGHDGPISSRPLPLPAASHNNVRPFENLQGLISLEEFMANPRWQQPKFHGQALAKKINEFVRELASKVYFGDKVLSESNTRVGGQGGRRLLDQGKLEEIKQKTREFLAPAANLPDFETYWAQALTSLQTKSKHLREGKVRVATSAEISFLTDSDIA